MRSVIRHPLGRVAFVRAISSPPLLDVGEHLTISLTS
jgi:hypothetical protein